MVDVTSRLRLVVDSSGVDRAGRDITQLGRRAGEAQAQTARLQQALAGLGAAIGGGALFGRALDAFNVQAQAVARVEQAIRSTGGAAGFTARELQRVASELQTVTLFGDEEILAKVTGQLLTFTNITGDQFLKAQEAVISLATAMDKDLLSAAVQVGKALNDPVRGAAALAESGIQFTTQQRELIASLVESGQLIEAQNILFNELFTQFGNQAQNAATVGTAAFTQLSNVVGDVLEVIGGDLATGLNPVVAGLRDFLSVAENARAVASAVEGIGGLIVAALAAPLVTTAASAIAAAFTALISPIGLAAAAVAGLVVFRDDIAQWAFGARDAGAVAQAAFEVLVPIVGRLSDQIGSFVSDTLKALGVWSAEVAKALGVAFPAGQANPAVSWGKATVDVLSGVVNFINDVFLDTLFYVPRAIQGLADGLSRGSLPESIRKQLRAVSEELKRANLVFRPEDLLPGFSPNFDIAAGIRKTFDDIAKRSREIVAERDVVVEGTTRAASTSAKALESVASATSQATDETEKLTQALEDQRDALSARLEGIGSGLLAPAEQALRNLQGGNGDLVLTVAEAALNGISTSSIERAIGLPLEEAGRRYGEQVTDAAREAAQVTITAGDLFLDSVLSAGEGFLDQFLRTGRLNVGSLVGDIRQSLGGAVSDSLRSQLGSLLGEDFSANFSKGFNNAFDFSTLGDGQRNASGFGSIGEGAGSLAAFAGSARAGFDLSRALGIGSPSNRAGKIGGGVGGATGTAIGTFFGGEQGGQIGGAIGAFIGNALGSLFGRRSNEGAGVDIARSGAAIAVSGSRATDETRDLVLDAASRVREGQDLLRQLGATLDTTVRGLVIGTRDTSQFRIGGGSRNEVLRSQTVGDAQELTSAALREVLRDARFDSVPLQDLSRVLLDSSAGFEDIISTLGSVAQLLPDANKGLTDFEVAVRDLNRQFDELVLNTDSANVQAGLNAARAAAIAGLRDDFDKQVRDALQRIESPELAEFASLLEQQANRLRDAAAVGGDAAAAGALNAAELQQFFQAQLNAQGNLADLVQTFEQFTAAAREAGRATMGLQEAFSEAVGTLRSDFNDSIQESIRGLLTGPLDELEALLQQQDQRRRDAEALGADLAQVARLTNLELSDFFQSLSEDAIGEVQDFLGLFSEAADSVARNLDLSRQDLRSQADQFGAFATQFADLSTDFAERFQAATPAQSLDILRGRASDLAASVAAGNASAAQALPQVLQQLVDAARDQFGNTQGFQDALAFARGLLRDAGTSALQVQSDAERQIAALDANNDILSDIRDILQSGQAFNALLGSAASGAIASPDQLLALIQQGGGLTPNAANDVGAQLSATGLIAQSLSPVLTPLSASVVQLNTRIGELPPLMRLQIDAITRSADQITAAIDRLDDRLERIERLEQRQAVALEAA